MRFRADQLCVRQGLCQTRTTAARLIEEGKIVLADGSVVRKASQSLEESVELRALSGMEYVSRGAFKLLGALEAFPHDVSGCVALDLGASTGGFTDVLLRRGASRVYAVDVGTDQLHPSLREDARVVSLEQTHAKALTRELVPDPVDVLVADVSFISLTKVLPFCEPLLAAHAWIAVLVKPQFEATPGDIGKHGIVKEESVRQACVEKVTDFACQQFGWRKLGVVPSPILGGSGNKEYLAVFEK